MSLCFLQLGSVEGFRVEFWGSVKPFRGSGFDPKKRGKKKKGGMGGRETGEGGLIPWLRVHVVGEGEG